MKLSDEGETDIAGREGGADVDALGFDHAAIGGGGPGPFSLTTLATASFTPEGILHLLDGVGSFWTFGMNESSPVSLMKNSSNQLKKTCLSSCERFTQSIESALGREVETRSGGVLNRLVGGGPGVGGLESEGEAEGEGECDGAPGRVFLAIDGESLVSGCDLPKLDGELVDREGGGGGGGLDPGPKFLEELLWYRSLV